MDYDKYPIENINARELNPWHFYVRLAAHVSNG